MIVGVARSTRGRVASGGAMARSTRGRIDTGGMAFVTAESGHLRQIRAANRFLSWRKRGRMPIWALLLVANLVRLLGALHQ